MMPIDDEDACAHHLVRAESAVKAPISAFIDVLQVWLKHPLPPERLAWLSGECGSPLLGPPFKVDRSPWWDHSYRQAFRLTQPTEEAQKWLAERDDVLLTYSEIAFDFIIDEASLLADVFSQHFVQRWHRSRETQLFENGNGRTGKRGHVGTNFQWYADFASKLTGEVNCFHFEAQIQGSAALRRLGINHPRDILQFDYSAFIRRHLSDSFSPVTASDLAATSQTSVTGPNDAHHAYRGPRVDLVSTAMLLLEMCSYAYLAFRA